MPALPLGRPALVRTSSLPSVSHAAANAPVPDDAAGGGVGPVPVGTIRAMVSVGSLLSLARRIIRVVDSASGTTDADRRRSGRRKRSAGARGPSAPVPRPGHRPARGTEDGPRQRALLSYSPSHDGEPDPGEIVWTWVAYEDDPSQGKDRPVLLVGRDGGTLLGLMLTSRDRNSTLEHDDRYVDIGTGAWDRQGRPSEVKVDRLLRIGSEEIRREGAVLDVDRFRRVIASVPEHLLG